MNTDDSRALVASVLAGDKPVDEAIWELIHRISRSEVSRSELVVRPFLELFDENHRFVVGVAPTKDTDQVGLGQSIVFSKTEGPREEDVE